MEIQQLLSFFPGIIAGFILGLTGAGGSIIAIPLLIFSLHITVAEAGPVALFSIAISASVAVSTALRQGIVRYRAAGLITIISILLTPTGIWVAHRLPDPLLMALFSGVLVIAAWYMYHRSSYLAAPLSKDFCPPCHFSLESGHLIWTIPCARGLIFSGIITGFLSGLLGVGGGFITIPALRKVSDLPIQAVIATSLAITALISTIGVISATSMGYMNWSLALPFSTGTVTGTLIGRRYAYHFDETRLQRSFAILAWGIALIMFTKAVYFI
ncbi:hypothetical conserved protein [Candidatus Nitrosoglobus terrae]|uniref:Probable membrane transporter protein n=1 Tax=Candidatus Nitrosoglobus terrae TaxID=1630141 RepID=A0A1Q2SNJ6_9GAMM|nr:sulfite exporter TauE/SafE family protein [Candidatus Nitrosoglobus terrae]BAW80725.1 hypothetical conserved protein [Candidatus Nitrosoglobus terrae]